MNSQSCSDQNIVDEFRPFKGSSDQYQKGLQLAYQNTDDIISDHSFGHVDNPIFPTFQIQEQQKTTPKAQALLPRKKHFIQTSQKTKKGYLLAKKGNRSETNQLTINIHTMVKAILKQMTVFFELSEYEQDKIRIFRESKPNLKALKNLLSSEMMDSQKDGQKISDKKTKDIDKIRTYIAQKLKQTDLIEAIFSSRKMSLRNKLTTLKYIQNLLNACRSPSHLTQWKGLNA